MKILILANFAGGLYLFRKELLLTFINKGYKVLVSVPSEVHIDAIRKLGCEVIDTPVDRRGMNPIADIKLLAKYLKIIRKYNPDCILTYTIKPNLYGGLAARVLHIPYLCNITGLGTTFANDNLLKKILVLFYRLVLKKSNTIFFQNSANKELMESYGINNTNMILLPGSGVNLKENKLEPYPLEKMPIKFLFVARVMRNKGIYELVEAAKIIKGNYRNVQFHVVGPCEDDMEKQVQDWHNAGLIIYHGQQNNVHKFMKVCHCLVHPSYHEGLSNVCLEAAATGRPILASNIPGCQETFDEGVTGFGFEPRNSLSIASTINEFLKLSIQQRAQMGKAGRDKVEKEFDREVVIGVYIKAIEKIENN